MTIQDTLTLAQSIRPAHLPENYEIKIVPKNPDYFTAASNITDLICNFTGNPRTLINKRGRKREISLTRKLIAYFLKRYATGLTLCEMGAFCNYDHSEIIKAEKVLIGWLPGDEELRNKVNELNTLIISNIKL